MFLKQGLVQVYYGKGKGKTTAAMGLAIRAAGQGLKVYIVQFLKPKKGASGEVNIISQLGENVVLERINEDSFIGTISEELRTKTSQLLVQQLPRLKSILQEGGYDLIILDEILNALNLGLINDIYLQELLAAKHPQVELVLTGRHAPDWLLTQADLVTEMRLVKHPYDKGITARKGIEY